MNSSPEYISEFGGKSVSELAGGFSGIPTIYIPKFDNIQSNNSDKVHGCQYCKKTCNL